jgi:uroporphyrinogen-III decarboxylase
MTKKEVFIKAITFQKSFPVPFVIRFTIEAEEQYRSFLRGVFNELGSPGGYIFSPSHALTSYIPPENIRELIGIAASQMKNF